MPTNPEEQYMAKMSGANTPQPGPLAPYGGGAMRDPMANKGFFGGDYGTTRLQPFFSPERLTAHQEELNRQRQQAIQTMQDWAAAVQGGVGGLEQARTAGMRDIRQQAGQALAGSFGGAGGRVAGGGAIGGLNQLAMQHGTAQGQYGAQMQQAIDQQRVAAQQALSQAQAFKREAGTPFEDIQAQSDRIINTWQELLSNPQVSKGDADRWFVNNVNMYITDPQARAALLQMAGFQVNVPMSTTPIAGSGTGQFPQNQFSEQQRMMQFLG